MSKVQQFGLLLWKNYLLQKRQVLVTITEISLPLLFTTILIILRQRVSSVQYTNATIYQPFKINDIPYFPQHPFAKWYLVYIPSNVTAVETIANSVRDSLSRVVGVLGFQKEAQFEEFIKSGGGMAQTVLAALVFDHDFKHHDERLPLQVKYHLRFKYSPWNAPLDQSSSFNPSDDRNWKTESLFPLFQLPGPREQYFKDGGSPGYYREGFLATQFATDKAIIKYHASAEKASLLSSLSMEMLRFPFPPYMDDVFILAIQTQLSLLVMLSFTYTTLNVTKAIVLEKETKQKEYMKMMGLNNWLHWLAWFLKFYLFLVSSVLLMTLLLCIKLLNHRAVLQNSDPTLIFFFLLLFAVSTISYSFMISVFFSKANIGAAVSGFLYFLMYIPYFFIIPRYPAMTFPQKMASCLLSNVAMAMGCQLIGMFEGKGTGIQWSNINQSVTVDDNFTIFDVIGMLIFDSLLYGLITWYVEAVFPGEYGIPEVWYFFILPSYWLKTPRTMYIKVSNEEEEEEPETTQNNEYIEDDQSDLEAGIKIKALSKIFYTGNHMKVAVSGLTVNLYKGQISVLLGHNGAGKTTTLSMLTGLFPPTSGTAHINGFNICKDMALVRQSLGLCPQHDVLFDNLTVEEHLSFFCRLKGYNIENVREAVNQMLMMLNFEEKRHAQAKTLSGGMKRKLSIGIALIGDSQVVMLDEPTSGMDPLSRRATWDLLQQVKVGRTIVLTTHYMDEADLLGDRILIMAKGQLQCCGSPLFLKSIYGAGYHMVIVKEPYCNVDTITSLVKSFVPGATQQTNVGAELSYILPNESTHRFEALFSELEKKRGSLGIASYGASVTTMEEVFLRVGKLVDSSMDIQAIQLPPLQYQHERRMSNWSTKVSGSQNGLMGSAEGNEQSQPIDMPAVIPNTGITLFLQQFRAMFMKRASYSWRNWKVISAQFMIPLIFAGCALIIAKTFPGPHDSSRLNLTLSKYGPSIVPYSADNNSDLTKQLAQMYAGLVHAQLGKPKNVDGDLIQYLLNAAKKKGIALNEDSLVGAGFEKVKTGIKIQVLFNNLGFHTPATSLMLVDNALFKLLVGPNASISTTNYPQPRNITEEALDQLNENRTGFALSFNLMYGMAFLSSTFALLLVAERAVKSKQMQLVTGLHIASYWLSALLWDLINYLIPCFVILLMFQFANLQPFTFDEKLGDVLLLLLLYGWSIIPLMYLSHYLFTITATAYTRLTIGNILSGTATFVAATIMSIPDLGLLNLWKVMDSLFLVLPNYCLGHGLNEFYQNYLLIGVCTTSPVAEFLCSAFNITYQMNYFSWESPGIGRVIAALVIQGLVFLTLLFLIEFKVFRMLSNFIHYIFWRKKMALMINVTNPHVAEDHDVMIERMKIEESLAAQMDKPLVLKELFKIYPGKEPTVAVNRINLAINRGDCFGLLGLNGAGKTTIFKILTGDVQLSGGDAFIEGHSILNYKKEVLQKIGYCPQFDALLDHMTGKETLYMYARMRGIPELHIAQCVDDVLQSLLLEPYARRLVRTYSGGNKRKLSTGVAMIGNPSVLFLDEPSTGMDPVSRRLLWDAVTRSLEFGKSVMITSHSMEECEALCTRLAVMVNGQFKCLGSPQHLKSKFGSGYTLLVKIKGDRPDPQPFKDFIESTFEGSIIKDEHHGMLHYHLTSLSLTWAQIFGTLERARDQFNIKDYSVSQISLEQVFLSFARFQIYTDPRKVAH
ncbi:ATP-binding cassette sub-family A member 3 [Amblyraja radiata]|uniref:ATP-binding cassette sub-family A member 3 n=1 Tax=Amblyraja radiata TaxID=386614 RepID=UPI00140321E3|nr:ATP-binding cassette sub-family A member 3 [Amblyraja radiata]XP_032896612.1 ATP-binding cassette sub-family A member 3 [Amblyraja radiata]XP_032896613.1 ATP-binding cassette sub-family A member 3 [Amblyraja radiata]